MSTDPFDDLDDYLALPRVSGLAVSADGSRVGTTVAELNAAKTEYVAAIWELDPPGGAPARRLTPGAKGETAPALTAVGDLLFPSVGAGEDDDTPPATLWKLAAAGGEAAQLAELPAGITAVRAARVAAAVVVGAPLLPSADTVEDERR